MKNIELKDFIIKVLIVCFIVTVVVAVGASVYFVRDVIILFFLSVILALFLSFFVDYFESKFKIRRSIGLILTAFFALTFIGIIVFFLLPPFLSQGAELISKLPVYIENLSDEILRLSKTNKFLAPLEDFSTELSSILKKLVERADEIIYGSFALIFKGINGLINLIAITVMAIYMTFHPRKHVMGIARLFGPENAPRISRLLSILLNKVRSWMLGQFTSMAIIAVIYIVSFSIIGIPHAFFLGLLGGIMSFVPYIGPVMGTIIPAVLAFSYNPINLIYIVVIYIVTQIFEGYIVLPWVMKERVNMPPVITIIAIVVIGKLFGIFGMLVALPATAIIIGLIEELYLKPIERRFVLNNAKRAKSKKKDNS